MYETAKCSSHCHIPHSAMNAERSTGEVKKCVCSAGKAWAPPVTHMPEKLYMSSATMSMSSTMAIGREWKIICSADTSFTTQSRHCITTLELVWAHSRFSCTHLTHCKLERTSQCHFLKAAVIALLCKRSRTGSDYVSCNMLHVA